MASSWNSGDEEFRGSVCEDDLEENYYSILNVASNATGKEITQAYHKFGLVYHPDKHKNPVNKRNAEMLFSKIKIAYDVLIDPHRRAIYDSVGTKGLGEEGQQIIIRSKTPNEIREEYEKLAKDREEMRLEKLTFSEGNFSIGLDMTNIFEDRSYLHNKPKSSLSISNYSMAQSIDFPLTGKDTVTLTGALKTEDGGRGDGSATVSLKRILSSNSYLDIKGTLGASPGFSFFAFKRFTNLLKGSSSTTFIYKNGKLAPIFTNFLNYQLTDKIHAKLLYRTTMGPVPSSMKSFLFLRHESYYAELAFNLSLENTYASIMLTKSFAENTLKFMTSLKHGYLGTSFSYAVEKQITSHTRVEACMVMSSMGGVTVNLAVHRGRQIFQLPICLSGEILPSAVFYGTVTPVIGYYVVKRLIIDPYKRDKEASEANRKQEMLKAELYEKRRLAIAAQELMKETVQRIIEREGQQGLIIVKGIYGKFADKDNPNFETEKVIDVTVPLQLLVRDHSFNILSDQSKSHLEGFYDPCIGETKLLYIEYMFREEKYQVTIADTENLRMPKSSHKVKWWSRPFDSVKR